MDPVTAGERAARVDAWAGKGVQAGDHNAQVNIFPGDQSRLEASGGRDAFAAGRDLTVNNQTFVRSQASAPVALAQLPPLEAGSPGGRPSWRGSARCLTRPRLRGRWWFWRSRGWPGWGRPRWRCTRPMRPGRRAGSPAGCCSSTCTATTPGRYSPPRGLMRCCGRWGYQVSTFPRGRAAIGAVPVRAGADR
jgi:hypothetical protein